MGISAVFTEFLYEPLDGRKVIWAVHQTNSLTGQYSPFPFNQVSVYIGNGWSTTGNKFVVPYAGVYHFHLTATAKNFGQVDYRVVWSDVDYASIYTTTTHNSVETRSRSIMIKVSEGDNFHIAKESALIDLYKNSFAGYFLSP